MPSALSSEHPRATPLVQLDQSGITINGTPTVLLCSSLFYFRIPRGLWRDRLRAVRAAGYTCIDVYFPWNHHELAEGAWDFAGERDVAAFLQLAADEGLWVLARPGPYICSEWDGGGLPAYLPTKPGLRLRDNEPGYLGHVARWFERILPIIRRFQLGDAGSVIAVQIENELDFYSCADPAGYMAALRDLALAQGITVPLVVCAGQGDITRAGGELTGLLPTGNFYPNDRDPSIEELVAQYEAMLRARGLPLCVTETNRAHQTLRRLLSCGAKWLGPYLQVSGTNMGFTNAINNWGAPMAFLASDYDFGGMIGSQGQPRAEVAEARLLSMLIGALGPALALAQPSADHGIALHGELAPVDGGPRALALHGGGLALALPNLGDAPQQLHIQHGEASFPAHSTCTVAAGRCPFLLLDLPLDSWGIQGTLAYATAELCLARADENGARLAFYADGAAEIALAFAETARVQSQGLHVYQDGNRVVVCSIDGSAGRATIQLSGGATLHIALLERAQAARLLDLAPDGSLRFEEELATLHRTAPAIAWLTADVGLAGCELAGATQTLDEKPKQLEHAGILRGFGWYRADLPSDTQLRGLLLHDAADVLSVYQGGAYLGTVTPGGGSAYLPAHGDARQLLVRAETWGHSNFDDLRLPALRLHALRGLRDITAVLRERRLQTNWRWYPGPLEQDFAASLPDRRYAAIVGWGGWMSADQPEAGYYVKTVPLADDADAWTLHFAGLQALVHVVVDGQDCGVINPLDPFVDISHAVAPGRAATIALHAERWQRQPAGELVLLEGRRAVGWSVAGGAEAELWAAAERRSASADRAALPYRLEPGQLGWLLADVSALAGGSWVAACTGRNIKVTALLNGRVVGRVWLPGAGRPTITGGDPNVAYLPAPWLSGAGDRLALLVEAVERDAPGELSEVEFRAV